MNLFKPKSKTDSDPSQKPAKKKQGQKTKINSKKAFIGLAAILLLVGGIAVYNSFTSKSATFGWIQSDWSGGNSENTASHETDQTGWSQYQNKDDNIDTSSGEVTLQNTSQQLTDTASADFANATANQGDFSTSSDEIKALKPNGAACQQDSECADNFCDGGVCASSCPSTVDDIEGNTYSTVQIGDQCWMAENLNVGNMGSPSDDGIIQKYCYDDNSSNCETDGGLYDWNEMMQYTTTEGAQGICPSGWHIPTDAEWHTLENYLTADGNSCDSTRDGSWDCDPAGSKLAGNVDGLSWNSGTLTGHPDFDSSGFKAPPAGRRPDSGFYGRRSNSALFWSSSESGSDAWIRYLNYNDLTVGRFGYAKAGGLSVRCLKDPVE